MNLAKTLARSSFAILLAAAADPALAADVGEVVLVRNTVRGRQAGGSFRPLAAGDGIALGLTVNTGADSAAKMTFDPQGALTLGARTEIVIDRSLVDRATGRNESALSVLSGSLRVALSRLFQGSIDVETPTAVVGVKGTDVQLEVLDDGLSIISVTDGVVSVRGKAGGEVEVGAGYRTVVAPGRRPTPPAPLDARGTTLAVATGGPVFVPPTFPESPLLDEEVRFLPPQPTGEPIPNEPRPSGTGPKG